MTQHTALYDKHLQAGARMVDYSGWEMPLHYGSQLEEHLTVRQAAGIFDVSHMLVTDIRGPQAQRFLRKLLANDVAKLELPGKALYSCLLNHQGGIIDDLITYYVDRDNYRIVSNAGTRTNVSEWLTVCGKGIDIDIQQRNDVAILALQGPAARALLSQVIPMFSDPVLNLSGFQIFQHDDLFIACTGYTGEDGFEIILPHDQALSLWDTVIKAGARPIGLGARDSLRLEAGMNLYGADMDDQTTPLETGLAWTVAWTPEDRQFIGREALEQQKLSGIDRKRVGLRLKDKGILRAHQPVFVADQQVGVISSGGYSPVLEQSIALARVDLAVKTEVDVEIRNKRLHAEVVNIPFI